MSDFSTHPLFGDRLARLRCQDCSSQEFRRHVVDISKLLVLPATQELPTREVTVTTPVRETQGRVLERPIILVPILRAGLALSEGFHQLLPEASIAHYGLARNEETLQPEVYFEKFPAGLPDADVFVLDPMLATGGSASIAISGLKENGATHLHFVCLVASPEGLARLKEDHSDVRITCAAIDEGLNEKGYIVPGLGDAGDRTFGTL
ncbi:uracil phosphoribosyltransferase [Akkermansiaceae bacterium]|nr:uracil phosphoribosyltransferase [Akkermansiaceae bacterium]MDB4546575.1 uracil phosphoribosyltransferase [Akkermansiaceae bacterium]